MYKSILVGFDGSDGAKEALMHAITLSKYTNSKITALWVKTSLPHFPETVDEVESEKASSNLFFKKLSKEVSDYSKRSNVNIYFDSKQGNTAKTILEYAKSHNFDLIVLGHKGHSKVWGGLLGHVADKISENAHCSVLIVRHSS